MWLQTDSFGAPKTYIYTGAPGDRFEATLTVTPASGDPIVATRTITLANQSPIVEVSANITNGHAPLSVYFSVKAQDQQGIGSVSIDYEGDGVFDQTQTIEEADAGPWSFQTTYPQEGDFAAMVRVSDRLGEETRVTHNAITVDVNNPRFLSEPINHP